MLAHELPDFGLARPESLVVRSEFMDLADGSQLWAGQYGRYPRSFEAYAELQAGTFIQKD